jgi:hypothetical protein
MLGVPVPGTMLTTQRNREKNEKGQRAGGDRQRACEKGRRERGEEMRRDEKRRDERREARRQDSSYLRIFSFYFFVSLNENGKISLWC